MKKIFLILLFLGGTFASSQAQTITMDFTVGILADSLGTPIADGKLIQIIASPDATFTAPTTTNFLGGDDILLWSGAFDSSTSGVTGAMIINLSDVSASNAGYHLAVRWFPSLSSGAATPGNTNYGQYGYLDDSSWIAPAAGSSLSYFFKTISYESGPNANSTGYATNITAVPEPSSYAIIMALFSLGLLIKHSWRSRIAA